MNSASLEELQKFWTSNSASMPILAALGLQCLTANPSAAIIESAFSHCALCQGQRRSRIEAVTMENESLIRFNKKLFR